MTLKTKQNNASSNNYDTSVAFSIIQEKLKEVLESPKVQPTSRYNSYYVEENTRLEYLRDYGKKYRKERREFGKRRQLINSFFHEHRGCLSDKKLLHQLDQILV